MTTPGHPLPWDNGQDDRLRRRLNGVLRHAWRRVRAYRELWQECGIDGNSIRLTAPSQLTRLPVITRHSLEQFPLEQRQDGRWPQRFIHIERSGGSTGVPFETPVHPLSLVRRHVRFLRALMACGYRPGDRMLMLTTRPTGRHPTLPGCFCLDLRSDQATMERVYRQFAPRVLYGPLNAMVLLARELAPYRHRRNPTLVVSTAEQLAEAERRYLESVFGTAIADFYGLSECGLVAWKPPLAQHYVTPSSELFLEFLPSPHAGSAERLVITNLKAGACLPLVRFDTGDLVERTPGVHGERLVGFRGRAVDCLWLADGTLVSPYRVTLLLEEIPGITRYQVVQRRDFSLDITIWAAPGDLSVATARARSAMERIFGNRAPIRVHGEIGDAGLGRRKFRPVCCEVDDRACAS